MPAWSCRPPVGRSSVAVGPGAESVLIELYAPEANAPRWDSALWDAAAYPLVGWNPVGCDVLEAAYQYGATDEAGVLSLPQAGQLDLRTRDVARELDPSNSEGPFFGAVVPGTPIRIRSSAAAGDLPAWTGYLDTADYDVATAAGRLAAVDGIAYLAQADVPDGTVLPNTLRARVRAVIDAVGLSAVVPVVPDLVSGQQLVNTGFEDAALGAWQLVNAGPNTGAVNYGGSHSGGRVLTVKGPGGYARAVQRIACEPGGVYTLTGYTKWNTGAGLKGTLGIVPRDINGAQLSGEVKRTSTNANPSAWEPITLTYTAPADGSVATIEAACQLDTGTTTATDQPLFDDVTLTGPIAGTSLGVDPPVAPFDGKARPAWAIILDACQDALTYPWLDAAGTLRFRSWGAFPSAPFAIGCGDPSEGPWLAGIRTIGYSSAGDTIRNAVQAWSAPDVPTVPATDVASIATYGQRMLAVDRVVPAFPDWSARILADRAGAGLSVDLGEVRPYTVAELGQLLRINVDGPQVVRVRDEDHGPVIDRTVGAIGGLVRVTAAGWSFDLVAMIPRVEWIEVEPPPEPIAPPVGGTWHRETRSYVASSDALLALTSGGSKYGAGAANSLPVGAWSGWTYRACLAFPAIPWTKVRAVVSATLQLDTSDQVRIGFGSGPTIELRRITAGWSAGSSSSPSGSNAVVWPGPPTTSTGAVRSNVTRSENAAVGIRVDAIARAWAPKEAGGSGAGAYGIMLLEGSGSTADTTEFWPVEKGGAQRPQLDLVLDVFD
jgi:hypothetical protein